MKKNAKCKILASRRSGQNAKLEQGFTLVELLVVMMVLTAIGTVVITIISTSLRSTNKTNTLTGIRQNGAYAVSQMSKMLRNTNSINELGGVAFTNCIVAVPLPLTPTPAPIPYSSIKITAFDSGVTVFSCSSDAPFTISSNSASLLDTSKVSVVSGSCYFTCTQESAIDAPRIGIKFFLRQVNEDALFDQKAAVAFETSVVLRNVIK